VITSVYMEVVEQGYEVLIDVEDPPCRYRVWRRKGADKVFHVENANDRDPAAWQWFGTVRFQTQDDCSWRVEPDAVLRKLFETAIIVLEGVT